jgi:membrane protease YdiL (CAAX protease family)
MIGRAFADDRKHGAIALGAGLTLVALQFQNAVFARPWAYLQGGTHLIVALGSILVMWRLAGRDFDTLGLRMRVEPSWRFWAGAAVLIAIVVGVAAAGYVLATGKYEHLALHAPNADTWLVRIPDACIYAPVFEELVYRVALCSALVPWIGRWPTVIASGAIFGLVHITYGVGGPDNFIAGYFFAWAYLRSGSVSVPIAMHAAGNLIAVLLHPTF